MTGAPARSRVVFLLAGGIGFVLDAGLLALLLAVTPLGPFGARPLSILAALTATWLINRHFGFGPSGRPPLAEWAAYASVAAFAALLNYAVYAGCLLLWPRLGPFLALALASLAAMTASWLGFSRWVFIRVPAREISRSAR